MKPSDTAAFVNLYIPFKLQADAKFIEKFLVNKHEVHPGLEKGPFGNEIYPQMYDIVMDNLPIPWSTGSDLKRLHEALGSDALASKDQLINVLKRLSKNYKFIQKDIDDIIYRKAMGDGTAKWQSIMSHIKEDAKILDAYRRAIGTTSKITIDPIGLEQFLIAVPSALEKLLDTIITEDVQSDTIFNILIKSLKRWKRESEFQSVLDKLEHRALLAKRYDLAKKFNQAAPKNPEPKPKKPEPKAKQPGYDAWEEFMRHFKKGFGSGSSSGSSSSSSSSGFGSSSKCNECVTRFKDTTPPIWPGTSNSLTSDQRIELKKNFKKWAAKGGHPDKRGDSQKFALLSTCIDDYEEYKC